MSKKILVIDDDPVGTRLIEYTLKNRGYQVLTAQNGVEGLKKACNDEPDLVVLDVMLPGIDGFEVCHRLRSGDKTAQVPILILSSRVQPTDRATGLKMGADDYLTKPATPSEILNRIESLLSQRTVASSRIAVFLSRKRRVGTSTALFNVAAAMSQMGKRVIAVDLCAYDGSISQQLGIKPQDKPCLLDASIDNLKIGDLESALAVHKTGVRLLRIPGTSAKPANISPSNIDSLFDKLGEITDYFLVDLPFQPTATTRAILAQCDLAVIISDYTLEAITEVKPIITTLHFLGIPSERLGLILIDPKGAFPELETAKIKPYLEANLGIMLLGTIPYGTDTTARLLSDSAPAIISSPGPLAGAVNGIAEQIMAKEQTSEHPSRMVIRKA